MSFTALPEVVRDDFIAKAFAAGRTVEEMARLYNLAPAAIKKIQERPDFEQRVAYYRQQHQLSIELLSSYRDALLPKAFKVVEDTLDQPGQDKQKIEMAKWLLDSALPKRQQHEMVGGTAPTFDIKIIQQVGQNLDNLKAIHAAHTNVVDIDNDPHLIRPNGANGKANVDA